MHNAGRGLGNTMNIFAASDGFQPSSTINLASRP